MENSKISQGVKNQLRASRCTSQRYPELGEQFKVGRGNKEVPKMHSLGKIVSGGGVYQCTWTQWDTCREKTQRNGIKLCDRRCICAPCSTMFRTKALKGGGLLTVWSLFKNKIKSTPKHTEKIGGKELWKRLIPGFGFISHRSGNTMRRDRKFTEGIGEMLARSTALG